MDQDTYRVSGPLASTLSDFDARSEHPVARRHKSTPTPQQLDQLRENLLELAGSGTHAYDGQGSGAPSIATDHQRLSWVNTPTPNIVCPDCRKPFEYGHLATANVRPGEPAIFRHNDCANPTLAKARPPEFWVDQVHDAVGDWEGL